MTAIDYDYLTKTGVNTITIDYNGSNDEGWVDDAESPDFSEGQDFSDEVYSYLRKLAYDILASRWSGWEINEGSTGTITIDLRERKTKVHHGERYEQYRWEDVEF